MRRICNRFLLPFAALTMAALFMAAFTGCDLGYNDTSSDAPLLAASAVTSQATITLDSGDVDFYTPPSTVPSGNHGDIIKYRLASVTIPNAPGFIAWNIMYLSTDALGAPNVVTGTVLVPIKLWSLLSKRPIIAYAVGTHGLAQTWAPSVQMKAGKDYESENIAQALNKNYAVVITDNPGYLIGQTPTYMSGRAQGNALLDMVIAASKLSLTGLSSGAQVAIWGYSQGGQTAAWAGEIQPAYAPGINLVGVAAGGIPADFFKVAPYLDNKNGSAFLAETVVGLSTQYPNGIPLNSLVNATGAAIVADIKTLGVFEALFKYMNKSLTSYVNGYSTLDSLLNIPSVHQTLAAQTLGNTAIKVPVYLYHGTSDEFIELTQALALKDRYCALGVNTTFGVYPGEHITTQFQAGPYVLAWFADRFNGKAAAASCTTSVKRPVSTANANSGDLLISLNKWLLNATVHLATLGQDVVMPATSTFSSNCDMTTKKITGTISIPTFSAPIWIAIAQIYVTMQITGVGTTPMTGTVSLDNDGILHVHGHMKADIRIQKVSALGIPIGAYVHTKDPVDFPIDFDGPISALGSGKLEFTGTTTFSSMTGNILLNSLFTTLMSGSGQKFDFIVSPPAPYTW